MSLRASAISGALLFGALMAFFGACSKAERAGPARLLVRSAELHCSAESLDGLAPKVDQAIRVLGGFVVRTQQSGAALSIEFRVPADQLEAGLDAVSALGQHVDARDVRAEDFTEEYVDREAQLRNLTASRERLLALLERAEKVDDALAVNRGLAEVQGEIEKLEGRTKYLEKAAAMSTVTATFEAGSGSWKPLEVARGAAQALVQLGQLLADAVIVVAVFSPVWASVWWLVRWNRRRRTLSASST